MEIYTILTVVKYVYYCIISALVLCKQSISLMVNIIVTFYLSTVKSDSQFLRQNKILVISMPHI